MTQSGGQEIVEKIELDNGMIELTMEAGNKYIVFKIMKTVIKESIGTKISNIKVPSGNGERYSSYASLERDLKKLGVPVGNKGYTGISPAQSEFCYR